jgi:hypothetical protein
MPDEMTERHLAIALRLIEEAERRIAEQRERIRRFREAGHDTVRSEKFLELLLPTFRLMNDHRSLLERERRADAGTVLTRQRDPL